MQPVAGAPAAEPFQWHQAAGGKTGQAQQPSQAAGLARHRQGTAPNFYSFVRLQMVAIAPGPPFREVGGVAITRTC